MGCTIHSKARASGDGHVDMAYHRNIGRGRWGATFSLDVCLPGNVFSVVESAVYTLEGSSLHAFTRSLHVCCSLCWWIDTKILLTCSIYCPWNNWLNITRWTLGFGNLAAQTTLDVLRTYSKCTNVLKGSKTSPESAENVQGQMVHKTSSQWQVLDMSMPLSSWKCCFEVEW